MCVFVVGLIGGFCLLVYVNGVEMFCLPVRTVLGPSSAHRVDVPGCWLLVCWFAGMLVSCHICYRRFMIGTINFSSM